MPLEADQIVDRRRLKRSLTFWRVLAVVALVAVALAFTLRLNGLKGGSHVARLTIEGVILDDQARDQALNELAENSDAKALIVRINSPGGTVVGGEALYHSLRNVAAKKPVIAVMGSTATSAGYMTALGADHIVARPGSVTGSIGVLLQTADVTGLLEKLGIKPETIKSRPLKAQPNPLEPLSDEAREATRAVVLDMFEMFVAMVEERRQMTHEKVLKLSDGRIFTGRQALANGLVDTLGGEPKARQWLAETHKISESLPVRNVEVKHEDSIWRDFIGGIFGKTLFPERLRLDGLISLWHPDLL